MGDNSSRRAAARMLSSTSPLLDWLLPRPPCCVRRLLVFFLR
jgi:hypothetical protein